MDQPQGKATPQQRSLASLIGSCALLGVALAPGAALCAWLGGIGANSIAAAAVALVVCWGSACLALVATFVGQRLGFGLHGLLISIFLRTGLPLAAGLALQNRGGDLAQAGVFYMILGLYLCALVVETALSLRFVPPTTVAAKSS